MLSKFYLGYSKLLVSVFCIKSLEALMCVFLYKEIKKQKERKKRTARISLSKDNSAVMVN